MLVFNLYNLNTRAAKFVNGNLTITQTKEDGSEEEVIWRLAYISGHMAIPDYRVDHLVSLQFVEKPENGVMTVRRFYYKGDDAGRLIEETPGERRMDNGQLLKKKLTEYDNDYQEKEVQVFIPNKRLIKKATHAVFFRVRV